MVLRAFIVVIFCACIHASFAQQAQCDTNAFREVVSNASALITQLHETNNKLFQQKLRKLRDASHWSDAEYVAKATPYVKDETTSSLDAANAALLEKVQSLEAPKADSDGARCSMLSELKVALDKVVANTKAKWDHMLSKIAVASNEPLQADVTQ